MKNILLVIFLMLTAAHARSADDIAPFLGRWALTIPGGGAGWLGDTQAGEEILELMPV